MRERRLVLAFDSDDPLFTRGFEAGIVWSFVSQTGRYHGIIHASNLEMVLRIAESHNLPMTIDEWATTEEWVTVHIGTRRSGN